MSIPELLLISVGLAMDAFAVSLSKGVRMRRGFDVKYALILAVFFGGFQALMPLVGWLVGSRFVSVVDQYDHFIAFALLAFIGVKMIVEAVRGRDEKGNEDAPLRVDLKEILMLAVATSIDALAVGVTFGLMPEVNVGFSVAVIGVVTFLISGCGAFIGHRFGMRFRSGAEIAGGVMLVAIGVKILLSGLGVIGF